ncbi:MAG: iron transporter [Burkholderiaceae bacterium]
MKNIPFIPPRTMPIGPHEAWQHAARMALRVLGAVGGGYAFCAACAALLSVALPRLAGLPRSEAVVAAAVTGFVLYLVVLIWAFSVRGLRRLWSLLASGTALACGLADWFIRQA